jgi:Mg2+ and Co2+ transporter CorA
MEEIANRISGFDEELMSNTQARTLTTLYSIYHLKHDLLHLRILFNPLKEIITRLERARSDDSSITFPRTDPTLRLGMKHHILRRPAKPNRQIITTNNNRKNSSLKSIYLNEYIFLYLYYLNNHIDQVIDSLEIQRESVSLLISFWITLNSDETQQILKILMLISVIFMPCILLTGANSTNFTTQPQYQYQYGYYIVLSVIATILIGMLTWYKIKRWI